jgi:hypothetical protein
VVLIFLLCIYGAVVIACLYSRYLDGKEGMKVSPLSEPDADGSSDGNNFWSHGGSGSDGQSDEVIISPERAAERLADVVRFVRGGDGVDRGQPSDSLDPTATAARASRELLKLAAHQKQAGSVFGPRAAKVSPVSSSGLAASGPESWQRRPQLPPLIGISRLNQVSPLSPGSELGSHDGGIDSEVRGHGNNDGGSVSGDNSLKAVVAVPVSQGYFSRSTKVLPISDQPTVGVGGEFSKASEASKAAPLTLTALEHMLNETEESNNLTTLLILLQVLILTMLSIFCV